MPVFDVIGGERFVVDAAVRHFDEIERGVGVVFAKVCAKCVKNAPLFSIFFKRIVHLAFFCDVLINSVQF